MTGKNLVIPADKAGMGGGNSRELSFMFDITSPYSYLGYKLLRKLRGEEEGWNKLKLNYVPANLGKLFKLSGNPPPATVSPNKAKYLGKDLKMMAEYLNVKFQFPSKFPADTRLILRVLTLLIQLNKDDDDQFESFLDLVWESYFVHGLDVGDEMVVTKLLHQQFGEDKGKEFITKANHDDVKMKLDSTTETLVKEGVFGFPYFRLDNEKLGVFGCDRLPLVAWKLGLNYRNPVPTKVPTTTQLQTTRSLTFYYDMLSPYSYISRKILQRLEGNWDLKINYQPVLLPVILKESGNRNPNLSSTNKRNYTIHDLKLLAKAYDIPYSLPTKFPFNTLVGQTLLAILKERRPEKYLYSLNLLWDAVVLEHQDVNDPTILKSILTPLSIHDLPNLLRDACQPNPHQSSLIQLSKSLVTDHNAFGLPYFHAKSGTKSRHYFGSDRLGAITNFLNLPYTEPFRPIESQKTKLTATPRSNL